MTTRVDDLVRRARRRIDRVQPAQLSSVLAAGGLVVDIRSEAQRRAEGDLDGAVVIERNVLEWRLDPLGEHRLPQVRDHDQWIVIVCSEGYASSLAAAHWSTSASSTSPTSRGDSRPGGPGRLGKWCDCKPVLVMLRAHS